MPTDMMPYKIRLVRAMPEKIRREKDSMWDIDRGWFDCDDESGEWAFWGPLADELNVKAISVGTFDGDCHFVGPTDLLEAIAEAVCQEAERKAKDA